MTDIRYGIIGAGMMGHEHIRNIALIEGGRVTAVCDPDAGMRASAAHLAGDGCAVFTDHAALLGSGLCDALVIAAPNHLHHRILLDVLPADLPMLVEKPLCTTLADCEDVLARAHGRTAQIWVAMEYRYMPPVERLIRAVRSGATGDPRMIAIREHRFPFLKKVGDWNRFEAKTGGTLVEKCCHFFDLMRLIAEAEPVRVYASGGADVNFRDELYDGQRPDILDNAFVVVDFANGLRGMLDLCMFAEGSSWQEAIAVTGDRAGAEAFVPGPSRFSPDGKERHSEFVLSPRAGKRESREIIEVDAAILAVGDHHGSTFFQHRKFFEMIRDGGVAEVSLEDGLQAVRVGLAAEQSVKTGQAVALAPSAQIDRIMDVAGNAA
ncbi:Gfo/Idh/MocA family protein [Hoeflea ulvae]|uniref:Gfo/Idh/MocA family oxidoreductase n=1 Tax=Hoeflea ulvae TaxID=2983764 RepID=A0ABT3Y9J6_9HYPH|nr:Gfo/Idh/MocA family oxidoreductase [Hoeflea ulvae]MCY0092533.1 Gfo/Idh/MocA family oxidoreductase [Hoeflea ulvae]